MRCAWLDNTMETVIKTKIWTVILETEASDSVTPSGAKVLAGNILEEIREHLKL